MKKISVVATRSVKISTLKKEYSDQIPEGWKEKDFPFSNTNDPEVEMIASTYVEAGPLEGEDWWYDAYETKKTLAVNQRAAAKILKEVSDPTKTTLKVGIAIPVKLRIK